MSWKCRPVVGSSKIKMVGSCFSCPMKYASLTRWFSPPERVEELFNKTVDVARRWKEKADVMAEKYGFIQWHIRSVDIYKDTESAVLRDFSEFE